MLYRYFRLIVLSFAMLQGIAVVPANSQEPEDIYERGIELYADGDFSGAAAEWISLINSGVYSAGLYYNTGNACFKSNDIPSAILYYEKALKLKPFDEDTRYNLEIARTYTVDELGAVPELFLVRWFRMVSLTRPPGSWALLSIVLFGIALSMILLWLLARKTWIKKIGFSLAIAMFTGTILALTLNLQALHAGNNRIEAIIFTPSVTGKSAPGMEGKELFVIHEGTKVIIEDRVGEWYEVRLSDGNVGWIPESDVRKI